MKYKLFGSSGLKVSELCLGTMTFGTERSWGVDKAKSKKIFDTFAEAGGNFLDTANLYTEGTSEKFLGDFIRSDRDHFVLATKYTLYDKHGDVGYCGNNRKNMMRSVETSLKRLDTDYIDLLWLHAWDSTTPVDEVMRGLDDLVRMGKVHYIGISDAPAWIISQANTMADLKGWTRFVGLQVEYSLIERTPERDLLPMAKAFNLALTPWAPLGGGVLTGKYLRGEAGRIQVDHPRLNEKNTRIAQELVVIAQEMGVSPGQVAINWTRQREQVVIPIVGATRVKQINDSLGALDFIIPAETMKRLDKASQIELGFPHEFLQSDMVKDVMHGGMLDKMEL